MLVMCDNSANSYISVNAAQNFGLKLGTDPNS